MRIEHHAPNAAGVRRTCVYDMPPVALPRHVTACQWIAEQWYCAADCPTREPERAPADYWQAVTDVPCPCDCIGTIRWAETGYVPGYRICDECGRHFLAGGTAAAPTLRRVGQRRSDLSAAARHRKADPHCTCSSCIAFHAATVRS